MVRALPRILSHPDCLFRWDARTGDIHLLRQLVLSDVEGGPASIAIHTNVPQELWLWPNIGYGWGPQRREGATLALGILDRHIPCTPQRVCEDWHFPLTCDPRAFQLAAAFQSDFLDGLPSHGGRIAGQVIRQWIAGQRRRWATREVDPSLTTLTDQWPVWLCE